MQKCSLCGGKVVNGRCEDCGLPIPPEHRYTLRSETRNTHEANGEDIFRRMRQAFDEKTAHSRPAARAANPQPRRTPARPYQLGDRQPGRKATNRWLGWFIAIVVIVVFFLEAIASLAA